MQNDEYNAFGGSASRHNINIQSMQAVYGIEGYGLICYIFSLIQNGPLQRIQYSTEMFNSIQKTTKTIINVEKFIIDCLFKFNLLEAENSFLYNAYFFKKKPERKRRPLPLSQRIKIKELRKARSGE